MTKDTNGNSSRIRTRHKFKSMFSQVKENISNDNVNIISAGISYYSFLAIFPTIAAIIAIYGLVADQHTVEMQLNSLAEILPPQSNELIKHQLNQLVQSSSTALGWSVAFSIIFSIWSANRGMKALFQGINIAYNGENRKGFVRGNGITILFTLIGILAVILSMALLVVIPVVIGFFDIGSKTKLLINTARWILLLTMIFISLGVIYHYAPNREKPKWRLLNWGSAISTILWIVGSLIFSFHISNFGNYNATYGSLASVVILLLWFYIGAYSIILGAEINSVIEHQTQYYK